MWPFRRGDLIERVGAAQSAAHESDEQAILDMLLPRAQARIDGQLRDGDALDTKALGVLGVDTAAVALLVAVRGSLNALWWIPTGALGVTGVLLLAAIWPRTLDLGPDPRKFYEAMSASRIFRSSERLPVLLWPGWLDLEQLEDASLGVGEAVEADAGGGVGEPESLEGAEDVASGGFGGAAFGQQPRDRLAVVECFA